MFSVWPRSKIDPNSPTFKFFKFLKIIILPVLCYIPMLSSATIALWSDINLPLKVLILN